MTALMLATTAAQQREARRRSRLWRSAHTLRYGWPLAALCVGMPIWFFLGVAAFVWSIPGLIWGLAMLAHPERWKVPHGGAFLAGAVVWIALSGIQVEGGQDLLLFVYRLTLFVSTFAVFMFVANAPVHRLQSEAVSDWMAALFLAIIGLGWLGLILGRTNFESPLQMLLPDAISESSFVDGVSRLRFAEVQSFAGAFGFDVPRPSAPFAFTNGWGSSVGLVAPYFAASWLRSPVAFRKRVAIPLAAISFVPIIVSMNRGLWLSLLVIVGLIAGRKARAGDWRMARNVLVMLTAAVVLIAVTPLGTFVAGKFDESEQSNESREGIYEAAVNGALESPMLGHGTPGKRADGPPIGSHGLVWWLMYCHGFVALGLFMGWMGRVVWAGRKIRTEPELWAYISMVVFCVQFPIYGLLPQLPLAAVSAGLVHRHRYPPSVGDGEI